MTPDVFGVFLTYLVKSDAAWPIYLPKNLTSYVNAPLAPGATLEVTVAKDRYNNATRNEVVTTNTNWTIPLTPLVSIYIK